MGVVFAKDCEFLGVPGGGGWAQPLGPGSGGWWGVVFPQKVRENGKGVGRGGVGTGKGTGKSMHTRLSRRPFSKLPFCLFRNKIRPKSLRRSFWPDIPADIRPKTQVRRRPARTSTRKFRSEKLRADFSFPIFRSGKTDLV